MASQHMRTTIERLVQVSYHRSGRNPGFAALRLRKTAAPCSMVASTLVPAGASAHGSMPAGAPSAFSLPLAHADLAEQEAARRASAPISSNGSRAPAGADAGDPPASHAGAHGGLRVGEGGDSVMADVGGAGGKDVDCAGAAPGGGHGQIAAAGAGSKDRPAGGDDGGILLKDVLYILENEVCHGCRACACSDVSAKACVCAWASACVGCIQVIDKSR